MQNFLAKSIDFFLEIKLFTKLFIKLSSTDGHKRKKRLLLHYIYIIGMIKISKIHSLRAMQVILKLWRSFVL